MTINEAGTPRTIDAAGNIVPVPNGPSRWASPRKYECAHDDCDEPSIRLSTDGSVHNCCGIWHHEEEGLMSKRHTAVWPNMVCPWPCPACGHNSECDGDES